MLGAVPGGEQINVDPAPAVAPFRTCTADPAQTPNAAVAYSTLPLGGIMKSGYPAPRPQTIPPPPALPAPEIADAMQRYFTPVTASNVYPNYQPPVNNSDFPFGSLYSAYQSFKNSNIIPNKDAVRRLAVVYMNSTPSITLPDCLAGRFQCMFFPRSPFLDTPSSFPSFGVGVATVPAPFTNAIREYAELVHRMVEEGIEVVVVYIGPFLPGPTSGPTSPYAQRDALFTALRPPVGTDLTDTSAPNYALCKGATLLPAGCSTSFAGEPLTADPSTACNCEQQPPRQGINIINLTQQAGEDFSVYQQRIFNRTTIELNRIMNDFKPVK